MRLPELALAWNVQTGVGEQHDSLQVERKKGGGRDLNTRRCDKGNVRFDAADELEP